MAPPNLQLTLDPLHECVLGWSAEQDRLEQDLAESLAALEAFQSQLDAWQSQLASDREQLETDRQALAEQQAAWQEENASDGELATQLQSAVADAEQLRDERLESTQRTKQLEERALETENKLLQAEQRAVELEELLDRERSEVAEQQSRWDEDFRRLRGLLAKQAEVSQAPAVAGKPAAVVVEDPVLDSVLAQFGKLRQQHAGRRSSPEK